MFFIFFNKTHTHTHTVRNNYFTQPNFGEWLANNIMPLPQITIALFSENPGISGQLDVMSDHLMQLNVSQTLSVFTGISKNKTKQNKTKLKKI